VAKDGVGNIERMVVTRVIDAPLEIVWKAYTQPEYVQQWWGPKGFTSPSCRSDFRVGGMFLYCMRSPDGQEGWTGGQFHEIIPHEKIVYSLYFADSDGNRMEPEEIGVEHEAIDGVYDEVRFEDLGDGRTKITLIGNESMESARAIGQFEGNQQILDKLAAVVATL
jgi:uncharacterized protein YndB with AHSA1/START domain